MFGGNAVRLTLMIGVGLLFLLISCPTIPRSKHYLLSLHYVIPSFQELTGSLDERWGLPLMSVETR